MQRMPHCCRARSLKRKQFGVPQSDGSIFFAEASLVTFIPRPVHTLRAHACFAPSSPEAPPWVPAEGDTRERLRSARDSLAARSTVCWQYGTTSNQSGARLTRSVCTWALTLTRNRGRLSHCEIISLQAGGLEHPVQY